MQDKVKMLNKNSGIEKIYILYNSLGNIHLDCNYKHCIYFIFHVVNDFKQQQSSQIRSIEKKYERIISEKTAKHQKEINVGELHIYNYAKTVCIRNYWQGLRTVQQWKRI